MRFTVRGQGRGDDDLKQVVRQTCARAGLTERDYTVDQVSYGLGGDTTPMPYVEVRGILSSLDIVATIFRALVCYMGIWVYDADGHRTTYYPKDAAIP